MKSRLASESVGLPRQGSRKKSGPGGKKRGRRLIVLALLGYFVFLMGRMEWQMYCLRKDLAQAEQQRQALLSERESLDFEYKLLEQPAYLERVAREELGLVRPKEVLVISGDRIDN